MTVRLRIPVPAWVRRVRAWACSTDGELVAIHLYAGFLVLAAALALIRWILR